MSQKLRFQKLLAVLLACCLLLACCNSRDADSSATSPTLHRAQQPIIVSAAASTQEIMATLASSFSAESHVQVKVNAGPSNGLANQIIEGAPADLFLSANRQWAMAVREAGLAEDAVDLVTTGLVMVVPQGNPAGVEEPVDLSSTRVTRIALAGEHVPAGKYAHQALTKLGLLDTLAQSGKIARAQDVRGALAFVERGEAEAGIVYSTDARVAGSVEIVHTFNPQLHDEIAYVLVLLKHGAEDLAARELFHYLQSAAANVVYEKAGFTRLDSHKK